MSKSSCQNHEKLNFNQHINVKISKTNMATEIIKRLSHIFPRKSFTTIYKSFIRPHFDYSDVLYDQPNNESLVTKLNEYSTMLSLLLMVQ